VVEEKGGGGKKKIKRVMTVRHRWGGTWKKESRDKGGKTQGAEIKKTDKRSFVLTGKSKNKERCRENSNPKPKANIYS